MSQCKDTDKKKDYSFQKCEKCVYYHQFLNCSYGDCRRHPPIVPINCNFDEAGWPQTTNNEWCGEFRYEVEE